MSVLILYMVVDDKLGMMFNNRRQSKDSVLRKHIIEESSGGKLWMNTYTKNQFEMPLADSIIVDDKFLDKAQENDYCFVENVPVSEYEGKIKKIILFRWNKTYPADKYMDIVLDAEQWKQTSVSEFQGSSHEKITKEIWEKKEI